MQELASDIQGDYHKANSAEGLTKAILNQKISYQDKVEFSLSYPLAIGALLLILSLYMAELVNLYRKTVRTFYKE